MQVRPRFDGRDEKTRNSAFQLTGMSGGEGHLHPFPERQAGGEHPTDSIPPENRHALPRFRDGVMNSILLPGTSGWIYFH
jgi:hypothetical protein